MMSSENRIHFSGSCSIDLPHIRDSQELLYRQRLDTSGISCLNMPGVEWIILGE